MKLARGAVQGVAAAAAEQGVAARELTAERSVPALAPITRRLLSGNTLAV
uniref:Uncharacterized protein n=1 Tax=Phenylobacterium glaciei TaxID=2803784 RepID=A0A974P5C9_9CAUL|nr:hypothetical protein JKL49_07350 [Phenylobacterium glaciei]